MWGKSRFLWVQLFFALITLGVLAVLGALGALDCSSPGEGAELEAPRQAPVGDPFLVTLSSDLPMTDLVLRWGGKSCSLDVQSRRGGWIARALLGTEAHTTKAGEATLEIQGREGQASALWKHRIKILPRKFGVTRLSLDEAYVTPPKKLIDRIAWEQRLTAAAKARYTLPQRWTLPLARPVPGKITGTYSKGYILNGKPRSPHRGLDFRAPEGTEVRALAGGVVALVGEHYYAGKSVYLDHGGGVISFYMHLSEIAVREGDEIKRGQVVGKSGSTGRSTGPHLHLGLCLQGRLVDPSPLFERGKRAK